VVWIGTSGFQYPEWKGKFYPENLSTKKMLAFYSERFNSTESNYTFRRMPTASILTNWSAQTPAGFRFSLKAPQAITHLRKLSDCGDLVRRFAEIAETLGPKLGAVLFQLEPSFRCDPALLRQFLGEMPSPIRAAFEFRHPSWFNDEVFDILRSANCALCIADSEKLTTPIVLTARHAYFRLRNEEYTSAELKTWAKHVRSACEKADETYVYFKHEERAVGPKFAADMQRLLSAKR
jgi:uncharacterized protein YecE (DUF72 family)